jgi:hypothetical protein
MRDSSSAPWRAGSIASGCGAGRSVMPKGGWRGINRSGRVRPISWRGCWTNEASDDTAGHRRRSAAPALGLAGKGIRRLCRRGVDLPVADTSPEAPLTVDRFEFRVGGEVASRAMLYGVVGAALSWSFTTLAVVAKNVMASMPNYLLIETAFTLVQWVMVAPLTALVASRWERREPRLQTAG